MSNAQTPGLSKDRLESELEDKKPLYSDAEARAEASRIREEAREQGAQIVAQHREQAVTEAERITSAAQAQIEVERAQALAQLKGEVGTIATTLAANISLLNISSPLNPHLPTNIALCITSSIRRARSHNPLIPVH